MFFLLEKVDFHGHVTLPEVCFFHIKFGKRLSLIGGSCWEGGGVEAQPGPSESGESYVKLTKKCSVS